MLKELNDQEFLLTKDSLNRQDLTKSRVEETLLKREKLQTISECKESISKEFSPMLIEKRTSMASD